jgi:hypothetical protein
MLGVSEKQEERNVLLLLEEATGMSLSTEKHLTKAMILLPFRYRIMRSKIAESI